MAGETGARRVTGERIIFWTLPSVAVIWIAAFFLFPGFIPPMSPRASAAEVAEFYSENLSRVRYSMILFNWFCVALIPILMLIVERMRGMAHRTPVLRYCVIGVAGGGPDRLPHLHGLLAHRRLPSRPRTGAHAAPQRPGLDHLHLRRPLPHRPVRCSSPSRSPRTTRTSRCSRGGSPRSTSSSASRWSPPASPASP